MITELINQYKQRLKTMKWADDLFYRGRCHEAGLAISDLEKLRDKLTKLKIQVGDYYEACENEWSEEALNYDHIIVELQLLLDTPNNNLRVVTDD